MYHNYLISTPTCNTLISVDVKTAENTGFVDGDFIKYHGLYTLYQNKTIVGTVSNLIIREKDILLSYKTEGLM